MCTRKPGFTLSKFKGGIYLPALVGTVAIVHTFKTPGKVFLYTDLPDGK